MTADVSPNLSGVSVSCTSQKLLTHFTECGFSSKYGSLKTIDRTDA